MNKLDKYNKKRNFEITKEPKGEIKKGGKKLVFSMQLHYASRTHYDLRLESKGVLISFAIPKCPSYNPKIKRLAVKTEDHPYNYKDYEGIIPKGNYGAGVVLLFDIGTYEIISHKTINKRNKVIKIKINGRRLKGIWNIIYVKYNNYLFIKEDDIYSNYKDLSKIETSIKTGRNKNTIELVNRDKNNIEGINITNKDKVLFPKDKITKYDIVKYYQSVAPYMLPFLENRLISSIRCPNGIDKDKFFQKHFLNASNYLGKKIVNKNDYYYIKDITGLISEVQMNSYEFHTWGSLISNINKPDILVFDLDPDVNVSLKELRNGVKNLKDILDELKLKSYLKTSGGKGYHVVVPIKSNSFLAHKKLAKNIADLLVLKYPDKYITNMKIKNRKNKIFIDYFRNGKSATSVCPYSIRLRDKVPISMPIKWNDLDNIKPNQITVNNYKKYIKKNPWLEFYDLD